MDTNNSKNSDSYVDDFSHIPAYNSTEGIIDFSANYNINNDNILADYDFQIDKSNLFQIGEMAKISGVTRKAILCYEKAGAMSPAFIDPESGFRYFSADNISRIRSIRFLQSVGLSLKEIAEYYNSPEKVEYYLNKLKETKQQLEESILKLELHATKRGDLAIHKIFLEKHTCYARRYTCQNLQQISDALKETDVLAVRTGCAKTMARIFTIWLSKNVGESEIIHCTPVTDDFHGPERLDLYATDAICIYFRGPYDELTIPVAELHKYADEHNLKKNGPIVTAYLEGVITYGNKPENFLTQVILPVKYES
ncbi:MAG: MerR family transcriptional regulator [Lachnospiraceae bacterium]|nr:MerR family transcriptional regulator [Lachnospiraceae bacterium]